MTSVDARLEAPERFIIQNMTVAVCTDRIARDFGVPLIRGGPISVKEIAELTGDQFLLTALRSTLIRGLQFERFFTYLRKTLLRLANEHLDNDALNLLAALAQQCFINEYVYNADDDEMQQIARWRAEPANITPTRLAAIAAYGPLHRLPEAAKVLAQSWPRAVRDLIRQQIEEPLAESREVIPVLTGIDTRSLSVQQQYEQNPYPRWTIAFPRKGTPPFPTDILIAGCGTGKHVFDMAQGNSEARILALDISRASLAYASRKTREAGLRNIEYGQADVLKLGALERRFDHIEAIGVLHHLADPKAGWRVLLSLLKPQGTMRVGLYSDIARREIVEARNIIASEGYPPTPEGIRALRHRMMGDAFRWRAVMQSDEFYYMSGCRDLLFHVMEHRFTLPDIAAFLKEQGLQLVEFEPPPEAAELFEQRYPNRMHDLDCWHAFELERPSTFRQMYQFVVANS